MIDETETAQKSSADLYLHPQSRESQFVGRYSPFRRRRSDAWLPQHAAILHRQRYAASGERHNRGVVRTGAQPALYDRLCQCIPSFAD